MDAAGCLPVRWRPAAGKRSVIPFSTIIVPHIWVLVIVGMPLPFLGYRAYRRWRRNRGRGFPVIVAERAT